MLSSLFPSAHNASLVQAFHSDVVQTRQLQSYSDVLVDGSTELYDDYAQAWRLLGLYVDCDGKRFSEQQERKLEDAGEQQQQEDQDQYYYQGCPRYLLWAAYVDEDYEGNGLQEYQFLNENNKWDKSHCVENERCARFDCHQANSHWKLLGFFKQPDPIDFLEVLTTYQGTCSWDQTEMKVMSNHVARLPEGCTPTGVYSSGRDSNYQIYIDLKPTRKGLIDIGLYSDLECTVEHHGSANLQSVLTQYHNSQYNDDGANDQVVRAFPYDKISSLNSAIAKFQTCQPCRTVSRNGQCRDADGENINVNQCSMFQQNTEMTTATYRDMALARRQGSILPSNVGKQSWWSRFGFLMLSSILFLVGLLSYCFASGNCARCFGGKRFRLSEPLIESS